MPACAPAPRIEVKPIGSRVDPLPTATPERAAGAEKTLPPALPGGWSLSGGPADYDAGAAATALGDEAGRFRGLESYAAAEYSNSAQRVIALEAFAMSSPESAANALAIGKPKASSPLAGAGLDEGFAGGLRAEARKGAFLARVRWFEADDPALEEAALDALRDVVALGDKAGLSVKPAPTPAPAPDASPSPAPKEQ